MHLLRFRDLASRQFDALLCQSNRHSQTPSAMGGRHPHLLHHNYLNYVKENNTSYTKGRLRGGSFLQPRRRSPERFGGDHVHDHARHDARRLDRRRQADPSFTINALHHPSP